MTKMSLRTRAWLAETQDGLQKVADSPVRPKLASVAGRVAGGLPIVGAPILAARIAYNLTRSSTDTSQSSSGSDDAQRRLAGSFSLVTAENDRVAAANRTKLTADPQKLMGFESQRISLLGGMANVGDAVRRVEIEVAQARMNGVSITNKEAEALKTLAREAALGVAQMKQQADATRIQSEAIGLSVGAATAYIAAQTRIADALRAKQPLTVKDIAQIKVEAAALGEATQAAERARINDQIRTDRRTVLLSTDDVAIAQQLRGIYPDVSQALASSEAAAMRFNMSSATSRRPARI